MSSSIYRAVNTTLIYIECGGEYLMLHRTKKENDCNRDKWIGIGGKFEEGESPEECALRETKEETAWVARFGDPGKLRAVELEGTDLLALPAWEGDKIFLRLLDENVPFFSLKLRYEGETLAEAKLNGKALEVRHG